jgi:hypothetical protein
LPRAPKDSIRGRKNFACNPSTPHLEEPQTTS